MAWEPHMKKTPFVVDHVDTRMRRPLVRLIENMRRADIHVSHVSLDVVHAEYVRSEEGPSVNADATLAYLHEMD